jgi:hypothetical protein
LAFFNGLKNLPESVGLPLDKQEFPFANSFVRLG